jgi:hypothetical protein
MPSAKTVGEAFSGQGLVVSDLRHPDAEEGAARGALHLAEQRNVLGDRNSDAVVPGW